MFLHGETVVLAFGLEIMIAIFSQLRRFAQVALLLSSLVIISNST
jgi:hypothetical protein